MKTSLSMIAISLVWFSALPAHAEDDYNCAAASTPDRIAYFEKVYQAIRDSDLPPEQAAQHFLNRLSAGPHPYRMNPASFYMRMDAQGNSIPELSTAAIKIACSIVGQVFSGSTYPLGNASSTNEAARTIADTIIPIKRIVPPGQTVSVSVIPGLNSFKVSEIQNDAGLLRLYSIAHNQTPVSLVGGLNGYIRKALAFETLTNYLLDNNHLRWSLQDFWFNHFNVDSGKVPYDISEYRRVIFENQFGKFSNLLARVIKHPAMLIYLDNYTSTKFIPAAPAVPANGTTPAKPAVAEKGPNENLGRELLELHTLGVGPTAGVYTQEDVEKVALILTGWGVTSLKNYTVNREFEFYEVYHDTTDKVVMGTGYRGDRNSTSEGDALLRDLAAHVRTAQNIADKLAVRYVSENPDHTYFLRRRMVSAYLNSDGNLREVYKELFASSEFWSEEAVESKAKRPLELVTSILRHTGLSEYTLTYDLLLTAYDTISRMGQNLTRCPVPTGYPDEMDHWINMSNTVEAIRFAVRNASPIPCEITGQSYSCYRTVPNTEAARDYNLALANNLKSYQTKEADAVANNHSAGYLLNSQALGHWYRFEPLSRRYRLTPDMADLAAFFAPIVATPDKVNGVEKPVRSMAGFFMGAQAFYRR